MPAPAADPAVGAHQLPAKRPPVGATAVLAALPAALRHGLFDPLRRGTLALAGLALIGALAAGALVWRARPRPVAVPRQVQPLASAGRSQMASGPVVPGPVRASAGQILVVEVVGAVRRPGLQRLPLGSRVADAVAAAGGLKSGQPSAGVNLARKLVDGEQVEVGGPLRSAAGQPSGSASTAATGPVDLNAATLADLDRLSGVGPVLAQRIIAWREQHGGFSSIDQLREVEGIGDRKFASLRAQVSL